MASFVNAVVFTAASGGTGTFTVASAVTGWLTPAQAGAVNAASYRYRAYSSNLSEWEVGTGTYTSSGTTLTRTPLYSSNANAAVNFTAAPSVALTVFAADLTTFTDPITPATDNAAALGVSGTAWSDLFLASGGVIDFNAGNYTLTHSAGVLTANGALSIGTGNALTAGTIELGAATDTTLSRGAAGFIAVEGNRVPSPASQASGDILYRGTTEWERLAKGTASQVLTMNSGATAPEWATAASGPAAATQAEEEAASSTTVYTSPGRAQFHPSSAKCWARITVASGVPTLAQNYNITSITDTATGQVTVTIATDFSSANYIVVGSASTLDGAGRWVGVSATTPPTAGAMLLNAFSAVSTLGDPSSGGAWYVAAFGDQ